MPASYDGAPDWQDSARFTDFIYATTESHSQAKSASTRQLTPAVKLL